MAKIDKLKQNFEILKIIIGSLLIIDGFLTKYLFESSFSSAFYDLTALSVLLFCLLLTIIVLKKMFDNSNEQEFL